MSRKRPKYKPGFLLDFLKEDPSAPPGTLIVEQEGKGVEGSEGPDPPPPPEMKTETFTCSDCGKFAFHVPTTCYWCRQQ